MGFQYFMSDDAGVEEGRDMSGKAENGIVRVSMEMRECLTQSQFSLDELRLIYIATPVSDYFRQDASLGGYVPHVRKLQRKIFLSEVRLWKNRS